MLLHLDGVAEPERRESLVRHPLSSSAELVGLVGSWLREWQPAAAVTELAIELPELEAAGRRQLRLWRGGDGSVEEVEAALERLQEHAARHRYGRPGVRRLTVVTNDVRYHDRDRRPLHDVLIAIRNRATLEEIHAKLPPNSEQVLKAGDELPPLFRDHEDALARTAEFAQKCRLSELDFRRVRFPGYQVPEGETPFSFL